MGLHTGGCIVASDGTTGDAVEGSERVETQSGLPRVTLGHERIMQVLLNMLMNAADATGPSGKVVLRAERNSAVVRLIVEDNGPGIHPTVRERLFEPFVTTKAGGLGVGLSICRIIVEAHGGQLQAEDNPGGGTIFRFTLPLSADS